MLTTIEYEDGAVNDLGRAIERMAPRGIEYEHHLCWGDDNGHSHVRAALLGPSLSIPYVGGRLTLGTWQQIILIDFDTRPRQREIVAQIIGAEAEKAVVLKSADVPPPPVASRAPGSSARPARVASRCLAICITNTRSPTAASSRFKPVAKT